MTQIPLKYKIRICHQELLDLRDTLVDYGIHYSKEVITDQDELELYRLSDLHALLFAWINPKLNSFEKTGRQSGTYEISLTHVMTLRHVLLKMQTSKALRHVLWQVDCIKVAALPIYNTKTNERSRHAQVFLQSG